MSGLTRDNECSALNPWRTHPFIAGCPTYLSDWAKNMAQYQLLSVAVIVELGSADAKIMDSSHNTSVFAIKIQQSSCSFLSYHLSILVK